MRPVAPLLLAVLLLLAACAEEDLFPDAGGGGVRVTQPTVSAPIQVVPSDGLPPESPLQPANNNLDVARMDGRTFLAFRTAPSHFASAATVLYVVSSADEIHWDYETQITLGTDLREPRLLAWNGRLFLYFSVLGENQLDFEPKGIQVTERLGPADWTTPVPIYFPGFMGWRTKVVGGVPYMLGYIGGADIYDFGEAAIEVHWLTTGDGYHWGPVVPLQPVVLTGGNSETDFVFLDDGTLVAVTRNEAGDAYGWGSKVCRAKPGDLGNWECAGDPRKYDSPLVFRHGSEVYLIGRRNLTPSGNFDLGLDTLSPRVQTLLYSLAYWVTPKRCSLWRIDPEALSVSFVLDIPSRGDTCFPALIDQGGGVFDVYNYTSPLDGPDVPWLTGQKGPTIIVRQTLTLP
jgi:hypothetical protein